MSLSWISSTDGGHNVSLRRTASYNPVFSKPEFNVKRDGLYFGDYFFFRINVDSVVQKIDERVQCEFRMENGRYCCKHCSKVLGKSYIKLDAIFHLRSCSRFPLKEGSPEFPNMEFSALFHNSLKGFKREQRIRSADNRGEAQQYIALDHDMYQDRNAKRKELYKRVLVCVLNTF